MNVEVQNPDSLIYAINHHAKELEAIVGVLALGFLLELAPLGWELKQHGVGAQSFSLRKGEKQYHLRARGARGKMHIIVLDRYQMGTVVALIKTRRDALKFIRTRVKE